VLGRTGHNATNYHADSRSALPCRRKKCAFTLAEVLITLGIIGVVAAITIPNMITNYQKKITVNKLKKVYSELQQAVRLSVAENGDTLNWEYGENSSIENSAEFAQKYFLPYLKVLKFCATDTTGDCEFHAKFLNGNSADNHASVSDTTKIFLMNGSELLIKITNPSLARAYITVDINGTEKPNIYGKDIFAMEFWDGQPIFRWQGTDREVLLDEQTQSCNKKSKGLNCGELIRHDGWTISKDYPW